MSTSSTIARATSVAIGIDAPPNRSFIVAVPVPSICGSQIAASPTSAPARTMRPIGGNGTRDHKGFARCSRPT